MQWSLVIPVKRLALAKTRLGTLQPGLALAFARDAVSAAVRTRAVTRVIVVSDDADVHGAAVRLGAVVRPDIPRGDLNGAIRSGASYAVGIAGAHPVAALPSDLPALTARWLQAALAVAALHERAFVPDAVGTGTTLLTARAGDLDPRYGPGSAARHLRAGAIRLDGDWPGLRRDVDTVDDLRAARALGLGAATQAVLSYGAATAACASTITPPTTSTWKP